MNFDYKNKRNLIDFSVHLYQIYNASNMDLTPVTYEQVLILFAETSKQLAETDKQLAKTDKQLAETGEYIKSMAKEMDARRKEMDDRQKETDDRQKETDDRQKEADARRKEADARRKEADARQKEMDARQKETGEQLRLLAKQVADVTDSIGRFAEEQVRPRILALFRAKGIELEETYPRVTVKKNGEFLLEIDLLLVNTIYSVVVEVKNTLRDRKSVV